MEDAHADDATAEFEEVEVRATEVVDDARVGVDLERVVVVRQKLKEPVVGAEDLLREKEEELSAIERVSKVPRGEGENVPRKSSGIKTLLVLEVDIESPLELCRTLIHDLVVAVLEQVTSPDRDHAFAVRWSQVRLRAEAVRRNQLLADAKQNWTN
mgnify:FL=1